MARAFQGNFAVTFFAPLRVFLSDGLRVFLSEGFVGEKKSASYGVSCRMSPLGLLSQIQFNRGSAL